MVLLCSTIIIALLLFCSGKSLIFASLFLLMVHVSVLCQQAAEAGNLEAGHMSDATASGPASDDEASSMAATVGSMLHTSPADREGSGAGSDSGGSQVDSVSGMTICCRCWTSAVCGIRCSRQLLSSTLLVT